MKDELSDLMLELWDIYDPGNKVDIHVISKFSGKACIKLVDKQLALEIVKRVNEYNVLKRMLDGEQLKLNI